MNWGRKEGGVGGDRTKQNVEKLFTHCDVLGSLGSRNMNVISSDIEVSDMFVSCMC